MINQSNNIIHYQHAVNLITIITSSTVCFPVRFIRGNFIQFYLNKIPLMNLKEKQTVENVFSFLIYHISIAY